MEKLSIAWDSNTISIYIAAYAALLSSLLALREIYLSLIRIKVTYFWTLKEGEPDRLYIYNKSKNNITVANYQLFFSRYRIWTKKQEIQMGAGDEIKLFTIAPNSFEEIKIFDQDKFKNQEHLRLYIELSFLANNRKVNCKVN